jgi:isorenieratene synthase
MREEQVVIIGGGLAGLTAGLHLAERGLSLLILEAHGEYPGGRVAGGEHIKIGDWVFRAEHGVHGVWADYVNLREMLSRHSAMPELIPAIEQDWVYKRGARIKRASVGMAIRYSPLPAPLHYLGLFYRPRFLAMLDIRDWLSLPLVWAGLVWGLGVDPLAEDQPLRGMSLQDMVRRWAPSVQAFMIGLTRNGLSGTPDEIPLSGYVAFLRFYSLLRRDSWGFSYFPADAGSSMIDPLVDRYASLGGKLELGQTVVNISRAGPGWVTELSNGEYIRSEYIILALDAQSARCLVNDSPDLVEDITGYFWPSGRETAVIRIWYDRTAKMGSEAGIFTGEFSIDNFFWLHRIQGAYRNWHHATGGSTIEVHIYGPPDWIAQPDTQLLSAAISDVQAAFPELRGHRIHQTLQRHPATHTMFAVDAKDAHLNVVTPWVSVYACGDWVWDEEPPLFMERAVLTGIKAANHVLLDLGFDPHPILRYPEPEPLAAAIQSAMRAGRKLIRRIKRKE